MEQTNKGLRFYRIICRYGAILLFATFIFAWLHLADAQQPAIIPRIGYIAPTGPENPNYATFLRGLRDLGYIEEKRLSLNIAPWREIGTVSQALWPNWCN